MNSFRYCEIPQIGRKCDFHRYLSI